MDSIEKSKIFDDEQAFEQLFKQYFARLVKYGTEIVKDINVAEEIVENVFVKLWENREFIEINSSKQQYLYKSVYNSCLNYFKHNAVKSKYELFFYHHVIPSELTNQDENIPLENLLVEEMQTLIQKTIDHLPEQCKRVFEMSRYEDYTNDEIAKSLSISINTVKTHIGRALTKLRVVLKDYNFILF